MFSTELANTIEEVQGGKYLPAGIHENVKFVASRLGTATNGSDFIEFTFEKDGMEFKHTEFAPNKFNDQTDEAFQAVCNKLVKRILQILEVFYPKEILRFEDSTFKEFITWVNTMLNNADKNKLVRLKIVYRDNGYTAFPKYCKFKFIEPMTISKENSKIAEITGIDQFTKPIVANKEVNETNPFSTTTQEDTTNDNDLPF